MNPSFSSINKKLINKVFSSQLKFCSILKLSFPILLMIRFEDFEVEFSQRKEKVSNQTQILYIPDMLYRGQEVYKETEEDKFKKYIFSNKEVIGKFIKKKRQPKEMTEFIIKDMIKCMEILEEELLKEKILYKQLGLDENVVSINDMFKNSVFDSKNEKIYINYPYLIEKNIFSIFDYFDKPVFINNSQKRLDLDLNLNDLNSSPIDLNFALLIQSLIIYISHFVKLRLLSIED